MWGCMTAQGVDLIYHIDGRMTAKDYFDILSTSLIRSMQKLNLNVKYVIFQQDNDPKHTAKVTKSWLQNKGFNVLGLPPQSPDLNLIENLWKQLKNKTVNFEDRNSNESILWKNVSKK